MHVELQSPGPCTGPGCLECGQVEAGVRTALDQVALRTGANTWSLDAGEVTITHTQGPFALIVDGRKVPRRSDMAGQILDLLLRPSPGARPSAHR